MEINAFEDATLTWEGDNGVDYMMVGCSPAEPFVVSESGTITGTFRGLKTVKV